MAECELNIPIKITSGSATLTSSDLNELGCSASTAKHLTNNLNERIESNDSGFSSRSSQSAGSIVETKPTKNCANVMSTNEVTNSKSKIRKKESPIAQKRNVSRHVNIIQLRIRIL